MSAIRMTFLSEMEEGKYGFRVQGSRFRVSPWGGCPLITFESLD
jgi:hypothetical protein